MQGNLQQNTPSLEVSRLLVDFATQQGAALKHVFLTTSGAMANENALKLVLSKRSRPADSCFEHTFADGRSCCRRLRISLPTAWGCDRGERGLCSVFRPFPAKGSTEHAVAVLKSHLARYPKQHAVMWMELVLGEGGYYTGDRAFFVALLDVLKANGSRWDLMKFKHLGGRPTRLPFSILVWMSTLMWRRLASSRKSVRRYSLMGLSRRLG